MYINRFQRVEPSWGYSGTTDRIKFNFFYYLLFIIMFRFTVDSTIWMLGLGLYGSMNGSFDYNVTIEVFLVIK